MKFGSLQRKEQKTFKVRGFKSGTVMFPLDSDIPDNALTESENMWSESGVLCTRAGLCADSHNIIKSESPSIRDTFSYKVTDSTVCINGEQKKVAVEEYCLEDSIYYCNIFFVGADGLSTAAGNFVFYRLTNEDFYQPINILFYSADPVNGAGIFALVTKRNIYNYSQTSNSVYELNANLTSWQEVQNFYVPVVYINGRGNRYEESKTLGFAYTGTPMFLESQNMLTDRFKAYFTSDGYSSCFRLPFTDLSNDIVQCRIYSSSSEYTDWVIMDNQTSVTTTFCKAQITLSVDRNKGMINFTSVSGDYSVPLMNKYHENNICVTAAKAVKNGFENAVSSTCCALSGSRLIFSGGEDKGRIFSVHTDNPLYFPCDSTYKIGGEDGINALLSYKNGVLAFKENEIYTLSVRNGTAKNTNSLLADDDSVFYNSDSFTVKKVNGDKGLKNKYSCMICGNKAVWLGSDKAFYSLNLNSFEIARLSNEIEEYLNSISDYEIQKAFAVQNENRYYLFIWKKAVIMEFRDGNLSDCAWYIWNFPNTDAIGGFSSSGQLCIFCTGADGNVFYTAKLSGEEDTNLFLNKGTVQTDKSFVKSLAKTKRFDFDTFADKKLIDTIGLTAAAKGKLEIFINGSQFGALSLGKADIDYTCGTLKSVKLIPHLNPVKSLQLEFSSDRAFSLGELIINYRETV